jgi:AcrR family transcriptional regulator
LNASNSFNFYFNQLVDRILRIVISFNQMIDKVKQRSSSAARRRDLVQIAYRLIAKKGLEGFRTRDVAEAAGIDTGTLHYHFPSKEALVQAVVEHLVEDFHTIRPAVSATPANALDELRNEIFDVVSRVRESPEQLLVMLDLTVRAARDQAVAEILRRTEQDWVAILTGILTRGVEQGVFRADIRPETEAILLRAQLEGLAAVGLGAPQQAEAMAAGLFAQLERWLSKPEN